MRDAVGEFAECGVVNGHGCSRERMGGGEMRSRQLDGSARYEYAFLAVCVVHTDVGVSWMLVSRVPRESL